MIQLRPYQETAISAIRTAFAEWRRVLLVSPTGSGKTVTFAYVTSNAAAKGKRVIVTAHRAEIVEQISRAIDGMGVRHGRIQPGHAMTADPVQVAMVQTLARRLDKIPAPDLLVVDEAHHAVAGTWATVAAAWPRCRILGVTATPQRLDGRGLADAFDDMVLGPAVADLIAGGHLARFRYLAPPEKIDLSAVKTRMGDFAINDLAAAMDKTTITGDAVAHYRDHLGGRPAVAFCVTVEHAEHVAEQFRQAGFRAASVDGTMERAARRDIIASLGDGRLQVLTSCELISEGVDIPVVAGAILLRPTKSLGMFLQQVGRALRPKPDGGDAVILDHVGNVHRHGLPDAPREWSLNAKRKRPTAPGVATCENCYCAFAVAPNWRAEAECPDAKPAGCILNVPEAKEPAALPAEVEGTLEQVTTTPEWAGGTDIVATPLRDVLRMARTPAQLASVAKARGYKPGWVRHILAQRDRYEQAERAAFEVAA